MFGRGSGLFEHTCNEAYVYPLTGEEFCVQGRTTEWVPGGSSCKAVPEARATPAGLTVHGSTGRFVSALMRCPQHRVE